MGIWKEKLQSISPSAANALGSPQTHPDAFATEYDDDDDDQDDDDDYKEDVVVREEEEEEEEKEQVLIEEKEDDEQNEENEIETVSQSAVTPQQPSQEYEKKSEPEDNVDIDIDLSDEVS